MTRHLATRWFVTPHFRIGRWKVGRFRWRAGLLRGEWWIGVRYDLPMDVVQVGFLGAVVVIGHA